MLFRSLHLPGTKGLANQVGEVGGAAVLALGDLHEHTCYIEAHIFRNARTILTNLDILLATSLTEILVSERFSHFEREVRLAHDRFVRGLQPPVYNGEAFAKLFLRDAQRRVGEESVPPHKRIESVLKEECS